MSVCAERRNPLACAMGLLEEYRTETGDTESPEAPRGTDRGAYGDGYDTDASKSVEGGGGAGLMGLLAAQHARMVYALDNVLDIIGNTQRDAAFAEAPIDIAELLRDVAQHSRALPARGVSIAVAQAADVGSVTTDRRRVQSVLEALTASACRAAASGSVVLSATALSAPGHAQSHLLLAVSHEGCGAEERELVEAAGAAAAVVGAGAVAEEVRPALLGALAAPEATAANMCALFPAIPPAWQACAPMTRARAQVLAAPHGRPRARPHGQRRRGRAPRSMHRARHRRAAGRPDRHPRRRPRHAPLGPAAADCVSVPREPRAPAQRGAADRRLGFVLAAATAIVVGRCRRGP